MAKVVTEAIQAMVVPLAQVGAAMVIVAAAGMVRAAKMEPVGTRERQDLQVKQALSLSWIKSA